MESKVDMYYLEPLNSEMRDKNEVTHIPILPGIISDGMNTEAADVKVIIALGKKV